MYSKILIIRLSSLGDVILTQSVAAEIKNQFPAAELHFITKKNYVPLLEAFGCIDQIHIWEEYKSFSQLRKLAKNKFELVIDLQNKFNSFLIKLILNSSKICTYNKQHTLRRNIVKHKTSNTISSTIDLYFSALQKIGKVPSGWKAPQLQPVSQLSSATAKSISSSKPNLAIFPGALHKTKQYPPELFSAVIEQLEDKLNIILLGSASEKKIADQIMEKTQKPVHNLCGNLDLAQLITFISKMDIILSNDSGPMHLAAALQKPQIAIFGATHPKLGFAPNNKNAVILTANLACQPCSLHGSSTCPLGHLKCLRTIEPTRIVKAVSQQIKA